MSTNNNENLAFDFSLVESEELRKPCEVVELFPVKILESTELRVIEEEIEPSKVIDVTNLVDINKLKESLMNYEQKEIEEVISEPEAQGTLLAVVPRVEPKEFVEATEIEIFRQDGSRFEGYKAIVNKEDITETYSIVTDMYKIQQHDEVAKIAREAIDSLELNTRARKIEFDNGARIQLITTFPDVTLQIGKDKICLEVVVDNSYNTTTGLRLEIRAKIGNRYLMAGEKNGTFYHRHTQGLLVSNFRMNLNKGIETFKTKFAIEFEKMLDKPITETECIALLDTWIEKKLIAAKYLNMMKEVIQNNGFEEISKFETVSNVWLFYNIIAEVLSVKCESADSAKTHMQKMFAELSKLSK